MKAAEDKHPFPEAVSEGLAPAAAGSARPRRVLRVCRLRIH